MATDNSLIRLLLIVIATILFFSILMIAFAMPMMGLWGWGHMWNGGGASWMWIGMMILPILLILVIGTFIYKTIHQTENRRTDPALEELRMAYARGDLSDEEFEKRRDRLEEE